MVYSYSRLGCFNNCEYEYYLSYVLGKKGNENIYSFLGSKVHELLEGLQGGKITTEQAVKDFEESIEDADMIGFEWMSDKVKDNYVSSIIHYLENWTPLSGDFEIEREFLVDINGIKLRGFIDIFTRNGNVIDIYDYKTSSKFAKKDLYKYGRQLVLYAYAIKQMFPDCEIGTIAWQMLKYARINGRKTDVRSNITIFDDFEPFIVEYAYNEETLSDLVEYVTDTVNRINEKKDEKDYDMTLDFRYCNMLCGHRDICKRWK